MYKQIENGTFEHLKLSRKTYDLSICLFSKYRDNYVLDLVGPKN